MLGGATACTGRNSAGLQAYRDGRAACRRRRRRIGTHHCRSFFWTPVPRSDAVRSFLCRCAACARCTGRHACRICRTGNLCRARPPRPGPRWHFRCRTVAGAQTEYTCDTDMCRPFPGTTDVAGRRTHGWPALSHMEFCIQLTRANRAGKGRLEEPDLPQGS